MKGRRWIALALLLCLGGVGCKTADESRAECVELCAAHGITKDLSRAPSLITDEVDDAYRYADAMLKQREASS